MGFLLAALLILTAVAVLVAEVLAAVTGRHPRLGRAVAIALVVAALLPIVAHMQGTTRYALESDDASAYPRLASFRRSTIVLVAAVAIVAAMLVMAGLRLLIVPLPFIAAGLYFRMLIPMAAHRQHGLVFYDNVPNVWMFMFVAAATLLLLVFHLRSTIGPD